MRLNRYLASATGMSRRGADEAIYAGHVAINGVRATVGSQVEAGDKVTLDGEPVAPISSYLYLMLNKPAGYVCSRRQQGISPTIYNVLPEQYHQLKPIGRLDRDTSGLLLLTNDGDTAFTLTHPSFKKLKTYDVTLHRSLQPEEIERLRLGIELEDGLSRFDQITGQGSHWHVILHEGRNRQIRRTFSALGAKVVDLHRTGFGALTLDGLAQGDYRLISKGQLQ